MRRVLIIAVALLTWAPAGPAHAAAPAKAPKLGATLESCTRSPLPVERIAVFVGAMPARAVAPRMQMRFELERRRDGERRWRRLKAEGFGVWERADPNVAGFVFTKRVNGLPVPAFYRALVRFRWLTVSGVVVKRAHARTRSCRQPDLRPNLVPGALSGAPDVQQPGMALYALVRFRWLTVSGVVVKRAHARTRSCRQPDLRPNLVPGALSGAPDVQQPGMAVYALVVRNTGRSAAAPFSVRVGSGTAEVGELAAGEERTVSVVAPACIPLVPVVVRVDADRRIAESEERGNGARRQCPLTLG